MRQEENRGVPRCNAKRHIELPGPRMNASWSAASSTAKRKEARSQPWRDEEALGVMERKGG